MRKFRHAKLNTFKVWHHYLFGLERSEILSHLGFLETLGYFGTRALKDHLTTQALSTLGYLATWDTLFSRIDVCATAVFCVADDKLELVFVIKLLLTTEEKVSFSAVFPGSIYFLLLEISYVLDPHLWLRLKFSRFKLPEKSIDLLRVAHWDFKDFWVLIVPNQIFC